tara:strand:- start:1536 stop:2078 length:543 start_codon:yes stop_codon:yes gene_type:complete
MRLFKENKLFKWYLERKGFLTQEECDKIISEIKSQGTLKVKENGWDDVPNGKFVKLDNQKLSDSIFKCVNLANDLSFKLDISGVQGCYGKEYYWNTFEESETLHCDIQPGDITNTATKITTILFLNDNYKGGELQIWDTKVKPEVGKLIIFPSFAGHKVKEFTTNDRYVVVTFIGGNHYV